ncbi:MAG TPA: phosphopentomutase [Pseudomonadota bacterium]|jgi:phosphopentomutase|nr:phosphopentomutase [Pseudomonadota bacterium]
MVSVSRAPFERVVLVVLDSCGCGSARDASRYGDEGANTLAHIGDRVGGLSLPHLEALGLGNITTIPGVAKVERPLGGYGRMCERSIGKDTTTGHWELAGLDVQSEFPTFPHGFPSGMIEQFSKATGRSVLGNKPASGTAILDELGPEHLRTGALIVYTSADSVFQIAAHEEVVPISELYAACEVARELCDEKKIARVIARPFVGQPGKFRRTYNRRDFAMPPPDETVLSRIAASGREVVGVGKIWDIFAGHGVTQNIHTEGNSDGLSLTLDVLSRLKQGLVFVNLVDFDMLYGHRRDPVGYARALEEFDAFLPALRKQLSPADLVILTADHGNDPTWTGTDHTREDVPLLLFSTVQPVDGRANVGERSGFFDVAQTMCDAFGLPAWPRGVSGLPGLFPV